MNFKRSHEPQTERIDFTRDQRWQANEFAQDVWQMVRAGRMLGEKFRRENPFGSYTLDFVSLDLRLVIEIDGKHHLTEEGLRRDARRDAFLRAPAFTVLRFRGYEVTQDIAAVRKRIEQVVRESRSVYRCPPTPSNTSPPNPSPRSGARRARVNVCTENLRDQQRKSLMATNEDVGYKKDSRL